MNIIKFIISLLTYFIEKLSSLEEPPIAIEAAPPHPDQSPRARTPTPAPINATSHHVSLYLKDGTLVSRSRSNDEYCIRTDGNVYVKDKGRWVHMPDVIGLSFYKKNA